MNEILLTYRDHQGCREWVFSFMGETYKTYGQAKRARALRRRRRALERRRGNKVRSK